MVTKTKPDSLHIDDIHQTRDDEVSMRAQIRLRSIVDIVGRFPKLPNK